MVSFELYNLLAGVLTAAALLYLLYLERVVIRHSEFLLVVTAGVITFAVGGPIAELIVPAWAHVVHAIAAGFVAVGLYVPIKRKLRVGESTSMLVTDPTSLRHPPQWMSPMDDDILELFGSVGLVLTPSIIAYNLDYSREEVNRHLSNLEAHDVLERVARGKYRLTPRGERYLRGQFGTGHDLPEDQPDAVSPRDLGGRFRSWARRSVVDQLPYRSRQK